MKNALFLLSIWVGIIVAAYALVYWDQGIEQPLPISISEQSAIAYVDPSGRFSLAVPPAWDIDESETFVVLTDPSDEIEVTVFSVEQPVPEAALLVALGITDSVSPDEAVTVEELSPSGEAERAVRIAGPAEEGKIRYGLAYLYQGESIVVLVRGSVTALRERSGDLDLIETGIRIPAAIDEESAPIQEEAPVVEL
jgi:hypothetical protein